MALAIALFVLIVASVLFHFFTPWTLTELASNWGSMDSMIDISFLLTGVVFVAVSLFVVYAVVRFRHRGGSRAEYSPDNKKLEWWLLGLTTVGIVALLAPGLVVYTDFVRVPDDAMKVEVFGEQWRFSYRYPGEDGELGTASVQGIGPGNPLGLDPEDPATDDDIVLQGEPLRLPVDRPVKIVMRSKDVIHSFFVPQFRAKMDMVPGMVTHFWLTPTRTGRFEVLCAQHCGVGHFAMSDHVVIMEQDAFDEWLAEQETFAEARARRADVEEDPQVARGRQLADDEGCLTCHSLDGSRRVGPSWKDLHGSEVELADGRTITVDESYIRESITQPEGVRRQGFPPVMEAYDFDDEQMSALVAFIRSLAEDDEEQEAEAQAPSAQLGRELASDHGCMACHSTDGSRRVGPTWKGLYGQEIELADGRTMTVDEDYIKESITNPGDVRREGFPPSMEAYSFSEHELDSLVAYIRDELGD